MQLRPQEIRNIYKAGIFLSLLIALFTVFVFMLSKEDSIFESKTIVYTLTKNVQNLKTGAAVHLKGMRIGTVKDLSFKDINTIRITFNIKTSYAHLVRKNSYVNFKTQGVLGDTYIEILGGSEETEAIKDGDILKIGEEAGMQAFLSKGGDILKGAQSIVARLDQILMKIENESNISGTLKNLNSISQSLSKALGDQSLKESMKNINHATAELGQMSSNLNTITTQIKNGPGTIHSLIYDGSVYEDLSTLLGGAQRSKLIKYFIRESIKKSEKLNN